MSKRIHAWLDGKLEFEALSPNEQERARRLEAALGVAADLEQSRSPGLASRVMAALPAGAPARRRGLFERLTWALVPSPMRLQPAMTLAAFCLVVGFGVGLWAGTGAVDPAGTPAAVAAAPEVFVRFDLRVAGASSVQLAGSFSGWQPRYALTPAGDDHWTVTIPLEPGVHDYVFLVDGERHVLDPAAPKIADGFGSYNNRIALLASAT